MRRCSTGYRDGFYGLPAGHVEEGELPIAALVREAKEEIGIDIDSTDLQFVHTLYRLKENETGNRVDYFFEASVWSGEPKNMEPYKCDEMNWFSMDALPENLIPYVREVIELVNRKTAYSEA